MPGGAVFSEEWCSGVVLWYCPYRRVSSGPSERSTQALSTSGLEKHGLSQENDGTNTYFCGIVLLLCVIDRVSIAWVYF